MTARPEVSLPLSQQRLLSTHIRYKKKKHFFLKKTVWRIQLSSPKTWQSLMCVFSEVAEDSSRISVIKWNSAQSEFFQRICIRYFSHQCNRKCLTGASGGRRVGFDS